MKSAVKSSKVNRAWLNDHVNDTYVKLAQKDGYRARAAYKLKEIDETLRLIEPGHLVVDLGSAPGAWSQYARRKLSPRTATGGGAAAGALNGRIIALDILPMEPIEDVLFIQGDIHDDAVLAPLANQMQGQRADVVLSDMAPNTSGHRQTDHLRIVALAEMAADFACEVLAPSGFFLAKVLQGGTENQVLARLKRDFASVRHVKPEAGRKDSAELYVLATGFRGGPKAEE